MNNEIARFNMIEQQIRPWEVLDQNVLTLLSTLRREAAVLGRLSRVGLRVPRPLYVSDAGMAVVAPLPDGVHRIVATVEDAPERPSVAYLETLMRERETRKD